MFGIIKQKPYSSIGMWEKYTLQIDHIDMFELSKQL